MSITFEHLDGLSAAAFVARHDARTRARDAMASALADRYDVCELTDLVEEFKETKAGFAFFTKLVALTPEGRAAASVSCFLPSGSSSFSEWKVADLFVGNPERAVFS